MFLWCCTFAVALGAVMCKDKINNQEAKCGRPLGTEFILKSERIVAGYDVGYYRYPWYAALMAGNEVSCGGALIGPRTVLSAAHCFKDFIGGSSVRTNQNLEDVYTIRLGMYNICAPAEKTVTNFKVEKVYVHELYQSKMPYFDISLLILTGATDLYLPVCLPKGIMNPESRPKEGTVPGMGTLKYQGPMPCTLHEARLLIYPDSTCQTMMNSTGNEGGSIQNAFCAGYLQGGTDTCQGDSGGPLQFINENGDYVVLGIVSFGFHCAVPNYLGMYTDVSKYITWIEQKSGLDFSHVENNQNLDDIIENSTKGPKKIHYEKPYRHPIRIIVLKNHRLEQKVRNMEYIPIKRIP